MCSHDRAYWTKGRLSIFGKLRGKSSQSACSIDFCFPFVRSCSSFIHVGVRYQHSLIGHIMPGAHAYDNVRQ